MMADSDYGTLSRGSPDSLQGYIEDDYECCTLLSADTNKDNEVEGLKKEIKNLKSIICDLIETNQNINQDISYERATLYKKIKALETACNSATPSYDDKQLNQLKVTLEQLKSMNEYNLAENTRLMHTNLDLAQKLYEHQSREPQILVKYIETDPKPKWAVDFQDAEDELTDEERKFVLNTIPSKKTREFLTKAVHRRRNGDFTSWPEKMAKTQRYIKKLQSHYDEEMDTANATLLELEAQLQERDTTISTLYQELEYEKYGNEENMHFYQQQIEDAKKTMEKKESELQQMSIDMEEFKILYEQVQAQKESQEDSSHSSGCAGNCKKTIKTLQTTIEKKDKALIKSHDDFHGIVKAKKELIS